MVLVHQFILVWKQEDGSYQRYLWIALLEDYFAFINCSGEITNIAKHIGWVTQLRGYTKWASSHKYEVKNFKMKGVSGNHLLDYHKKNGVNRYYEERNLEASLSDK